MEATNPNNGAIDWSGIRAAAVTLGIRRAARNAAKGLPADQAKRLVDRIRKRAEREEWSKDKAKALEVVQSTGTSLSSTYSGKPLSPSVATGAESVANSLAEDSKLTKVGLSTATRKAAGVFATMEGETVINKSEDLKRIVSSAAQIHDWDSNQGKESELNLNVLGGQCIISVNTRKEPDQLIKEAEVVSVTSSPTLLAPTQVDWEAVRILALAVGAEEAARRMGLSKEEVLAAVPSLPGP